MNYRMVLIFHVAESVNWRDDNGVSRNIKNVFLLSESNACFSGIDHLNGVTAPDVSFSFVIICVCKLTFTSY